MAFHRGTPKRIRGEGPIPCRYICIREFPGKDEAYSGRPFHGKAGREVERYFDGTRLPAFGDVFATSYIKEWAGPDGDYTAADYARDLPELETEIRAVRPTYVFALGRGVTRHFLGDVDLEEVHSIPWRLPLESDSRRLFEAPEDVVVVPIINPAAGFRSPELSALSAYGFAQLEGILDGRIAPRILYDDPIPHPVYEELTDEGILNDLMLSASVLSCDTEGWPHAPWSIQLTTRDGHAYIIRYRNKALIELFAAWVNADPQQYFFIFHNSLHELAMFRAFGIDTTRLRFEDTMIGAYNLQLEPQGLKPLSLRFCNMKMMHYDECMGDASFRLAQDWLLMAHEMEEIEHGEKCQQEFVRLTTTPYTDAKGKIKAGRKIKVAPKLPKSDLHKAVERCLRSANPRKLWGDQVIDRHVEGAPKYGEIWEATLDHVPYDRAIRYAGRDSDATHRLKPCLVERLKTSELLPVYAADLATVPLIDRMQQIGIKPDLAHFRSLGVELGIEIVEVHERIRLRLVGAGVSEFAGSATGGSSGQGDRSDQRVFNPNSTYHVGELLYEKFSLDVLKRTPGGDPSTNDKILEALEKDIHLDRPVRDLIADIREYREIYKLKHTFVDKIPDFVNCWPHDGRIHPTYRITRVVTGRLAASNPNILALPKHGKFATRFRQGFVAGDGQVLASWDLSQIELRVLAHLSEDPVLLAAFRTGQDLHAKLAQRIFGGEEKDHKKGTTRLAAKAVNFGIPMGMTNVGLCIELRKNGVDVNEDDAQRWLTETMLLYGSVPVYQQSKIAQARRYGYVTDLRGRRRYIGGIRSWDDAIRSEAERFAFSTPIQAGAQSIMKRAEAHIYTEVLLPRWAADDQVEPLVQIHDDLVFECEQRIVKDLDKQIVYALTQVPADDLIVPIETSGDCGPNWGDMHEIQEKAA